MSKLPYLAAAFLLLCVAHAAADPADDWATNDAFGVDAKSCSDWAADAHKPAGMRNLDAEWMFGFLTALVRAKGPIEGGGMTAEGFPQEIDEICSAHPQWELPEALEYYAVRHKLISSSSVVFQ